MFNFLIDIITDVIVATVVTLFFGKFDGKRRVMKHVQNVTKSNKNFDFKVEE